MFQNLQDVYIWFELKKGLIPNEVEDDAQYHQRNLNKGPRDAIVYETDRSYFLRTPLHLLDEDYFFDIYTAGWQNLLYRIFVEINPDKEIEIKSSDYFGLNKTVEGYNISPVTIGDCLFVQDTRYYIKNDNWNAVVSTHIGFVLSKTK